MEIDLRARLLADADVAALVGTRAAWIERPTGSGLPSITMTLIVPGRAYTYSGASELHGSTVQFDCWAASYGGAKALSDAVIAAVEPTATQGGTFFQAGFVRAARDFDPEDLDGGVRVFRRSIDIELWWRTIS